MNVEQRFLAWSAKQQGVLSPRAAYEAGYSAGTPEAGSMDAVFAAFPELNPTQVSALLRYARQLQEGGG